MSVYDSPINFPAFGGGPLFSGPVTSVVGHSQGISGLENLYNNAKDAVSSFFSGDKKDDNDNGNSALGVRRSGGTRVPLDYYGAPLATRYGMNATTAYQEALANTAHQREVADLQAAGLNPILSTRYGGSAGVSGAQVLSSGSGGYGGSGTANESFNLSGKAIGTLIGAGAGIALGIYTKSPGAIATLTSAGSKIGEIFDK